MLDELHRQGRHVLFEPHSSIQSEVFTSQSLVVKTRNSFAQERNRSCSSPSVRVEEMIAIFLQFRSYPFTYHCYRSLQSASQIRCKDCRRAIQRRNQQGKCSTFSRASNVLESHWLYEGLRANSGVRESDLALNAIFGCGHQMVIISL